jgi:hypothetical protein
VRWRRFTNVLKCSWMGSQHEDLLRGNWDSTEQEVVKLHKMGSGWHLWGISYRFPFIWSGMAFAT